MSASAWVVLAYSAWTLTLLCGIAVLRGALTVSGRRAANSFAVSGEDVSPFSARLCRAHANCCENLPPFAAIVLTAIASGASHLTDPLAPWALAARIAQSTVHLVSTSETAVRIRFGLFAVQISIQSWWIVLLLRRAS